MLGTVEIATPEWHQLVVSAIWALARVGMFVGMLVYPWPKGARCRMLQIGTGLMAIDGVWGLLSFAGVLGPPISSENEAVTPPEWWDYVGMAILQFGGVLLAAWGAWLLSRQLVGMWGAGFGRNGGVR